jgi:hypothetical protein
MGDKSQATRTVRAETIHLLNVPNFLLVLLIFMSAHKNISRSLYSVHVLLWRAGKCGTGLGPHCLPNHNNFTESTLVLCYTYVNYTANFVRFQVLTALPPSSGHLWNVGRHPINNTAVHSRRFWASYTAKLFMSMGWDHVSELQPPTGLFFDPHVTTKPFRATGVFKVQLYSVFR